MGDSIFFYAIPYTHLRNTKKCFILVFGGDEEMVDYQKMYYLICDAASKAIDASPEEARQILKNALNEAEDIYIRTSEENEGK